MELELKNNFSQFPLSKGPPPGMESLRPTYRNRASLIKEAQAMLDAAVAPKAQDVDEHGQVKRA